jgi:hypothetical protein
MHHKMMGVCVYDVVRGVDGLWGSRARVWMGCGGAGAGSWRARRRGPAWVYAGGDCIGH